MQLLLIFLVIGSLSGPPGHPQKPSAADAVLGRWYVPSRQSSIEFFKAGDRYFARITDVGGSWKKNYSHTKGKVLLTNLRFDGKEWAGGEVIHPASGLRFDAALSLKDPNTISAIAFKNVRFLHKEFVMIRQTASLPADAMTGK